MPAGGVVMSVMHSLSLQPVSAIVIGDLMVDKYLFGEASRISPEAPVIVLDAAETEFVAGGAAGVATFLQSFGAKVSVAGVVGSDAMGQTLIERLNAQGINCKAVMPDENRVTTTKERFLGTQEQRQPRQILRVDHETRTPISEAIADRILSFVAAHIDTTDLLLVADYAKGVCTESLVQRLVHLARANGIPLLVDPGRGVPSNRYTGAWLLKPNRTEASAMTGRPIQCVEEAKEAAIAIMSQVKVDHLIITLDADGAVFAARDEVPQHVPTGVRQVADITGAGDMFLAALALALGNGLDRSKAVEIANYAAGLEVERIGSCPISLEALVRSFEPGSLSSGSKLVSRESLVRIRDSCRQSGKRIVFTNGCFDLLHVGHVACLEEARKLGDILVVGLNSDAGVRGLKGCERPIVTQSERVRMLTALSCVSYVVLFDEDTPCSLLKLLRPDVLVKGGSYRPHEVVGHEIVEQYGGRVELMKPIPGISTSQLIERIQNRELRDVAANDYTM